MSTDNPYAPPDSEVAINDLADPTDLASRGARLGGAIIDAIIAGLTMFPAMWALGILGQVMAPEQAPGTLLTIAVSGFALFLILHGYLLLTRGQTIGKYLVKTRIVSIHDDKILPFWKLIGFRYAPVWVLGSIPGLGMFFSFADVLFIFRGDRRCLHDLIAGTKVVTARGS